MQIIYEDKRIIVAVKPAGVLSTDEPGGMPSLLREYLGDPTACVRTVHRLDRTVSGLMVFARSRAAASILSQQVREHRFQKEYLAAVHGCPVQPEGCMRDLLLRYKAEKKTYVVQETGRDVQEAVLHYRLLAGAEDCSLLRIRLETGRTHQIRVQLSSRGLPILGDGKYGVSDSALQIALWSCNLAFQHPESGEAMTFCLRPPEAFPWNLFPAEAFG